jgi:hypothetical protein
MRGGALEHGEVRPVGRTHPPEVFERDRVGEPRLDRVGIGRKLRFERVERLVTAARDVGDPQRDRLTACELRVYQPCGSGFATASSSEVTRLHCELGRDLPSVPTWSMSA